MKKFTKINKTNKIEIFKRKTMTAHNNSKTKNITKPGNIKINIKSI